MKQIKILAVNDPAVYAYVSEEDNAITKTWEELNELKVVIDIIEWDKYKNTLDNALKNREGGYDIVMNPGNFWLPELVEKGLIIPLEEYLYDYDIDGIIESIQDEMKYNDQIFMIPAFSDGHLLFYRKDLFEEKGIKINKQTVSIPELKDIVRKYSNDQPVIALKSDATEILLDFLPFLWERGVELLDQPPFFSDKKKTILALEDYLSFKLYCPQQVENYGNVQVKKAIQNGEVVVGVSWGGQASAILNPNENPYHDRIGFMTYQYPCNTTWGFVVAANSPNKEAAISYLKYVTNQKNDKLVGRISGGPVRKTTYQNKNELQLCPWYEVQYHMLINAKHVPKSVRFAKASSSLYTLLHRVFKQEITPNEMMELLKA